MVSNTSVFYAVLVGLVVGALISAITEYYTGLGKKPVLTSSASRAPAMLPT
jgi:K(+)-stimulated pyrophosphate-energized sodium pump